MKIKFNYINVALLSIATIIGTSCTKPAQTIKILQTSDIHGSIFPYDFINNRPKATSLAHVSTFIMQERAKSNQSVILLDNGDLLQGQPTVYYYNFIDTSCENIASKTFNYLQYDAGTLGNHDIEAGPNVYRKVEKESNFPLLAANAIDTRTGKCAFTPYVIIVREGIKVAVIGLITPNIPNWLPKEMWPNMEFEDMVESAQKWIDIVKKEEKPDIIVGLFHSGYDFTYGNTKADDYKNENASLLVAEKVIGFDAIMIGHDHDAICKKIANNAGDSVLIIDPASNAKYVAQTTITISKNIFGRIVSKDIKGELVDMKEFKYDDAFMKTFEQEFNCIKSFVNQPIGDFSSTISSRNAFVEPTAFIDFIHSCQLDLTGADISFVAPLSFVSTIKKGHLTISDMFKLYKFENFLYTMTLTGYEIDKYLEYNADQWFNTMKGPNDHLLNFKKEPDGSISKNNQGNIQLAHNYYSYDSGAGIIYTIDVTKPENNKVTIISMADGSPFNPEQNYIVAINSYRGNGGGGHLSKGIGLTHEDIQNRRISSTDKDFRYCMMNYIKEKKTINPKTLNTWKLIPEKWTKSASRRDLELLFPKEKK